MTQTAAMATPGMAAEARGGHRFEALDGCRGLCAVLVAWHHFQASGYILGSEFVRGSYLFVDFFFVLSGFVITHSYAGRMQGWGHMRRFMEKRILRLWPVHVITLLGMVLLEAAEMIVSQGRAAGGAAFQEPNTLLSLVPNILLVQALGFFSTLGWNIPSWSISVEMATYVVFMAIAVLCRGWESLAACGIVVFSMMVLLASSSKYMNVTYDYGLYRCLMGFFVGSLLYRLHRRHSLSLAAHPCIATALELLLAATVVIFVAKAGHNWFALAAPALFAVVILVFVQEAGTVSRWLRLRPMVTLGTLSYAFYMVHYPIFIALRKVFLWLQVKLGVSLTLPGLSEFGANSELLLNFGHPALGDLACIAFVLVSLAAAAVLHRLVEVPGRTVFLSKAKPAASLLVATADERAGA
jgi:peptidoglycan/LPS O-acetylase OafA/YrhL